MFTLDIAAQIFPDKSPLFCGDLIEPKFYFASEENIKEENGMGNVYNQLLDIFRFFVSHMLKQKDISSE